MHRRLVSPVALAISIAASTIFAATVPAQRRATAPAAASSIPSPKSVFGFDPGQDRTIIDWKQITDYFARLDKASDRVSVENIGTSTLGRPMIAAFISAPENIRNLDKYKAIQAKLADPRKVTSDAERDQLIEDGKTVVAISCSIHSTEIVASQMSTRLAYELANDNRPDTLAILHNVILVLIPSPNPDGVDIVANHYRKTLGTNSEGSSPPELYHYYAGHDDNRDWFMLDLKETKNITRLFWKEWFPQIVYDIHQQGSNGSRFFVPPFYDPPNPHINALLLRQVGLIGHKMAADVTAAGYKGILTNALYDTWWHGGFRTAPYFHNSVGILTEAASARLMSPSNVTREQLGRSSTRGMGSALDVTTNFPNPWAGGAWRPADIMGMEMIACHSLLSLASNYRADYLRNFYELGKAGLAQPSSADPIAYLIPAGQGRDENLAKMIGTLVEQGVEVYRLDKELHGMTGAQVLRKLPNGTRQVTILSSMAGSAPEIPAGSYIVFINQPYRQNVLALFEPQIYPDRTTATGEAERPYDVAGWTLPMSMGLDTPAVISITEPADQRKLTLIKSENDVRKDLALSLWTTDKSPIANPIRTRVAATWTRDGRVTCSTPSMCLSSR
jgi:Zinc carboxypeptidase